MTVIGMLNKDFKLPPKWTDPLERNRSTIFTCFETRTGGQWAFLGEESLFRVAGSKMGWKEVVVVVEDDYLGFHRDILNFDLVAQTGHITKLELDENEKLWLAASIKAAADLFWTRHCSRDHPQ